MWVVKTKGESYYVDHVECSVAWSTKETPDNAHTKGSLKVKRCLLTIDDENCAMITELTDEDAERLKTQKKNIRIITSYGYKLREFLKDRTHGEIKMFGGGCSTAWFVTELYSDNVLLLAQMAVPEIRVLMPNEFYYKQYDSYEDEYEYDENMMKICLKANGWSIGWAGNDWVGPLDNPDRGGMTLRDAFSSLLESKNLYGKQFEYGWKDE